MKKLISLALALTMVLSLCPTILSTNASAWTDGMWSGPDTTATGVSAVVSYTTEVIRVATARYSPLKGTYIVAATPSGSPEVGNNTAVAYSGENVVYPKVYLELSENADSTPTISFASAGGQTCSITPSFDGVSGTTYEWTIPYDGATARATAGDTINITFTYDVAGVTYQSYGALNVQPVQGGVGVDLYRGKSSNSTGGSTACRFEAALRVLGKGLYAEVDGSSTYGGFGASDGSHNTFNFNAAELDYDSEGNNLQYFHVTTDASTNNCFKAGVYKNGKTVGNLGYVYDNNRVRGTLYVDRSQYTAMGASGVNFRYELVCTGYDSSDKYASNLSVNYSYLGAINYALGGDETEGSSGITTSPYVTQPQFGDSYAISGKAVGNWTYKNFGGNLSNLGNSTGSSVYSFSWCPQIRGWDPDECKSNTSMGFYVYMVDKGTLRSTINAIQSGTGLAAAGLNANGANPQASAFTSTSYATFLTAYRNALKILADGKSKNQNTINSAVNDLKNAYNGLSRLTGKVYAHCIMQGTQISAYNNWSTDLYVANGGTTAALTSPAKDIGSTVTFTAPSIPGYTLQSAATQTATVADQATIICYYTLAKETYTFDPVVIDAGDPKTKAFDYTTTFTPLTDAPDFTYNHYHVEGWYKNYNPSTGAYSNLLNTVTVDTNPFTLYAKWTPNPTVVHYDLGSTGATMSDSTYYPGDVVAQPADPSVPGYAFIGWFTDATYITAFNWGEEVWYSEVGASTASPYDSEEITVYAQFESYDNKIVFRTNGGELLEPLDVAGLSAGASITLPTPTKTGYEFGGWYLNDSLTGTSLSGATTLPASLVGGGILYAKWNPKPVTLTFNIGYNPVANNSAIDTTENPDSISGYTGESIRDAAVAAGQPLPANPIKFGYVFGGWYIGTNPRIMNTEEQYNTAVSSGAITLVNPATDNFPASASTTVALSAVWVKTDKAAFIELDAYKEMYGELVPVADTDINPGDVITVQMKSTANFYTASTLFVYMYDNTMFDLVGTGTDAFTVNSDNGYISAISGTNGTDYTGYTASPARAECPSGYNWIQISIDPDVLGGVSTGGEMNDGKWMVQFKLRVKDTAARGSEGIIYMDNAWTRDPDNNSGTMFYGWLASASTTVWNSHNNFVTPLLQLATDTVTIAMEPAPQSTITANPNGGTWADSSTGTKSFTGDVGEAIEGYADPVRRGYELTSWQNSNGASDTWVAGYYGSEEQDGNTYVAQWTPVDYPVTWDANGGLFGTETTLEEEYGYEVQYSGPATLPVKQGYVVTGWSLTSDGAAVTFPQTMSDAPVTYYAVWGPAHDTPFTVKVVYLNNQTGNMVMNETTGGTYVGTTGATVHFVEDASGYTNTDSDVYFSYSDLPTVVNGRYTFDKSDTLINNLTCTIAADGSSSVTAYYRGALYTGTFSANGGTFTVPAQADGRDEYGAGYVYENNTTYVLYKEFQTSFADENDATKPDPAPVDPVRYGYSFLGWNQSATATTPGNIGMATANRSYNAVWQGYTVTNTFNAGEGTFGDSNIATADTVFGSAIITPNSPTRPSYQFLGWSRTPGATQPENLGNQAFYTAGPNDTYVGETFYAVWQLTSQPYYEYIYIMGTDGTYPTDPTYTEERSGSGTVTLDHTSYVITGASYFDETATNGQDTAVLNESTVGTTVILKAYIGREQHALTVNYTMSDGSTAPAAHTEQVYYEAAYSVASPAVTGYTPDVATVTGTMGTADVTEAVTYTPNEYAATFYADGTEVTSENVAYNAAIPTPAATPVKEGNTFAGWSRTQGATTPDADLGNMDSVEGVSFYAVFTPNDYTITYRFRAAAGTTINFTTANYTFTDGQANQTSLTPAAAVLTRIDTYAFGETIVAPAISIPGYQVATISPAIPETMPAGNRVINITISVNTYTLTVNYVMSDGSTAPAAHTEDVAYNASYSVASPAVTGYTPDVATVTGTMDDTNGKTVTVTYTPNAHTVTWVLDGGNINGETANVVQNYVFGDTIVAPAQPVKDGYTFDGWTPAPAATVADEDYIYTATWTTANQPLTINYVMADGKTELAPAAYTGDVAYLATYEVASPAVTGYTPDVATVSGTMDVVGGKTVTVTYTPNDYALNITYVMSDGTTAPAAYTAQVAYNTAYSVASPAVTGYTPDVATVAGTMDDVNGKVVTVTYTPNEYALNITYVMSDGTAAPAAYTAQVAYNTAYSVASPAVAGYTPDVATVTGTMDDVNGKAVTVTYTPDSFTLTVNYVMSDGTTAPAAHTEQVVYLTAYSVASPEVAGYTPDVATVTGTMDDVNGKTVTVTYTINTYTVTFLRPTAANADSLLDANSEKTVADWAQAAAYATESTGSQAYNSAITVPATLPEIANYTFNSEWVWFNADTGAQIEAQATVPAFNVTAIAIYNRVPVSLEVIPESGKNTVIDRVDNPTTEFTGYIYGLDTGITTAQFESQYAQVVGDGHLVITPVDAYAVVNACGTNTKVELVDNVTNKVVETYYIVIFGDLNGDGKVNGNDVQVARMEVAMTPNTAVGDLWSVDENDRPLDPETTPAAIMLAADLNGDGRITSTDTSAIRSVSMGLATIDQVTGTITAA